MNKLFAGLTTLLFPSRCVFCGGVTPGDSLCCDRCHSRLRRTGSEAETVFSQMTVYSCFYYKEQCKAALNRFKFQGEAQLADYFAGEMAMLIEERTGGFDFDHVVYLPMPELREKSRGYNQGKLLAAAIAAPYGKTCDNCGLIRPELFAQHDLHGSMRRKQSYGGFDIAPDSPVTGSVLLVDDVATTGSSLVGCAQLLHRAGAGKITAVTAAR